MKLEFEVKQQVTKLLGNNVLVADSKNYVYAHFDFTEEWSELVKTVFFKQGDSVFITLVLDQNDSCLVPKELLAVEGNFTIHVVGSDNVVTITTNPLKVFVKGNDIITGDNTGTPTVDFLTESVTTVKKYRDEAEGFADETKETKAEAVAIVANIKESETNAAKYADAAGKSAVASENSAKEAANSAKEIGDAESRAKEYAEEAGRQAVSAGNSADGAERSKSDAGLSATASANSAAAAAGSERTASAAAGSALSNALSASASATAASNSAQGIAQAEQSAAASARAATQQATDAALSATAAAKSEDKVHADKIAAETAATAAAKSETNAAGSEANAANSATAAAGSAQAAVAAKNSAANSATEALASAEVANSSKTAAAGSASNAKASETAAATSAAAAKVSETNSAQSATTADEAATAAGSSVTTASAAKTAAANSAAAAKTSETNAANAATAAGGSADSASASAAAAVESKIAAASSENNADTFKNLAHESSTAAAGSATTATTEANRAKTEADRAVEAAAQAAAGGVRKVNGISPDADGNVNVPEYEHPSSGVTAGTYRSVTVNAQGHITEGSNPNTLAGYGLTDAKIAGGVITLGVNTITPLTADSAIDASKLTGVVKIENLPPTVIERIKTVEDDAARFALTTATVQNGDSVKVVATNLMYYVKDDTKLGSADGYEVYTAGAAASVPWSGVTGLPATFAPSAHNHKGNEVTLTGYAKATAAAAITATDSVNIAIGKLEKALDGKQAAGSYALAEHSHNVMTGANASEAGTAGFVPAPAAEQQNAFLGGDGTWKVPLNNKVTQEAATTTDAEYPLLLAITANQSTNTTDGVRFAPSAKFNPVTKTLTLDKFKGTLIGNADTATKATQDAAGNNIATTYATKQELANKADKATTLAGYGIADAKITGNTITLGSNTITPLTQHQSLEGYASLASPTFTGAPKVPTAATGTASTQIANTAFVATAVEARVASDDVGNVAGKIPRFTAEGHLLLPSGIEIW